MSNIKINPQALEAINNYSIDWDNIGFGKCMAPTMIVADYNNGKWGDLEMVPYGNLTLSPTCKVFHYAQEIFEGMKAYRVDGNGPLLFRPYENAKRFNISAERMVMPTLNEDLFVESVKVMAAHCKDFIPTKTGESLYIRPFMFATEEHLGIKPADQFKYMVLASPSGAYFSSDSITIQIERRYTRACPGGTGYAKTGGNYAASLKAVKEARERGFDQTLWLDSEHKRYLEELSGMNIFCLINGELHTPAMTESILDGITRRSLIDLAKSYGITVHESKMDIDELIAQIQNGSCTEAFACGTAAIITPIGGFGETDGKKYELKESFGPIASKLRDGLLSIQEGKTKDPFNWIVDLSKL